MRITTDLKKAFDALDKPDQYFWSVSMWVQEHKAYVIGVTVIAIIALIHTGIYLNQVGMPK